MRQNLAALTLAIGIAWSFSAQAALYNWSFGTEPGAQYTISGSGTITTAFNAAYNFEQVTAVTGTIISSPNGLGGTIRGLLMRSFDDFSAPQGFKFAIDPYESFFGGLYYDSIGVNLGLSNIFYCGRIGWCYRGDTPDALSTFNLPITATVTLADATSVPEPATPAILTALAVTLAAARRRATRPS